MPGATRIITSAQEAVYKADFAKFDADKNGALEAAEVQEMAKFQLGSSADTATVDALVAEMDKNGDGKIEIHEYIGKIVGEPFVVRDTDDAGEPITIGRTYWKMEANAESLKNELIKIYDEMKLIPLVCSNNEEKAEAMGTFLTYMTGVTVLNTKSLVGKAMNMGKNVAWNDVGRAASGAAKAGNWLVLDGSNGAADLQGMADATSEEAKTTLANLFTATKEKNHADFPDSFGCKGMDDAPEPLEAGEVLPEFRVLAFSKFLEEDIETFFKYGQIPLSKCHLFVVTE